MTGDNSDCYKNNNNNNNNEEEEEKEKYFKGFQRSREFERLWFRLQRLERWKELAIRPSPYDCDPEDMMLLQKDVDDVPELQERCINVRRQMNDNLPPIEQATMEKHLVPKTSTISGAGLGLFYMPPQSSSNGTVVIPPGTVLCYYTGHIHNFHSAKSIQDKSYLMMVQGEILVDPGRLENIKARYINDPLNTSFINCKYVPQELRSAVTSIREIYPGEELFASYGEIYWKSQKTMGKRLKE